jgi:DNA-binding transcriptional ArsR family regulator
LESSLLLVKQSLSEIGRVTGVSRPTLYELQAKYGQTGMDFNFTLLQTIALRGPLPISEITKRLGEPSGGLSKHLQPFIDEGLVDIDVEPGPEDDVAIASLTAKGLDRLEAWEFHLAEAEQAGR